MNKENIILIDNDKEQMKEFKDGIEKTSKKKWKFVLEKSNKEKNSIIRYIRMRKTPHCFVHFFSL